MTRTGTGSRTMQAPIMIAGSGRSGTTWVLDVIATTFRLRPVFEPLHATAVTAAAPYAWRYVTRDSDIDGMDRFFRRVFSGHLSTLWTDFRVHPRAIFPRRDFFRQPNAFKLLYHNWRQAFRQYDELRSCRSRQRIIVKCIRANLLLGWLAARFEAKILLLVRHPGAVVESKLRIGGISWEPSRMLDVYRRDAGIQGMRDGLYRDLLHRDLTPAQAWTLVWCIENQLPMAEAERNGYLLVHYEDLVDLGDPVWSRIAAFFGLTAEGWDRDLLYRPSQQASADWQGTALGPPSHRNWLDRISTADLDHIAEILQATEESAYDAYEPLPKHRGRWVDDAVPGAG